MANAALRSPIRKISCPPVLPLILAVFPILWFGAASFPALADPPTWEELSSRIFNNAVIVWQAPTNDLPKSLWIYHRRLPHIFPVTVISNAVVLGSLQKRGFPNPSTNDFFIPEERPPNYPGPIPVVLGIRPGDANLYFSIPHESPVSEKEIPDEKTMVSQARKYAAQLGLNAAMLIHERSYTHFCDTDQTTNNVCGRGVFFPHYLDGVAFFSPADDGEGAEGFSVEFGEHGKIQAFSVRWSEMERYKNEAVAHPNEIIRCIKAHKAIVIPNPREDYFANLRKLATATKFTITNITPCYGEGEFGKVPTNDAPNQFATPFAELEGIADFGYSSAHVKLVSPILSSEVRRLLAAEQVK
jgi:hypothetical protein